MIKPVLSAEKQVRSAECQIQSAEFGVLSGRRKARHSALGTRYCTGFTLLELIIVISIVAILAGMFLGRVSYYQEQAEKTAMEQVSGALQTALVLRYGTLKARGAANEKELGLLTTDNPMNWLQQKPRNYAGEFFDPATQAVAPGNWVFDLKTHDLIYVINRADDFKPGKDGKKWIRFHVKLGYEPALGRPTSGKELSATLFEPTEPYHWLD
jgi:prepilin-type N-terminal cleavage/methylation domain-containing protein